MRAEGRLLIQAELVEKLRSSEEAGSDEGSDGEHGLADVASGAGGAESVGGVGAADEVEAVGGL